MLNYDVMERRIREYMSACTSGDRDKIASYFEPNAVHYFPVGMYGGPFVGRDTIATRFSDSVKNVGSAWTVDSVMVDVGRQQAAIEWTHFKTVEKVILRGAELYAFAPSGLIQEIRAYYASPQAPGLTELMLGGFEYSKRGYPMEPTISAK